MALTVPCGGPGSGEGQYIPLGLLKVDDDHGMYVGWEWELGSLVINASTATQLTLTVAFLQPGDTITMAATCEPGDPQQLHCAACLLRFFLR